jgi:hypothetical protein
MDFPPELWSCKVGVRYSLAGTSKPEKKECRPVFVAYVPCYLRPVISIKERSPMSIMHSRRGRPHRSYHVSSLSLDPRPDLLGAGGRLLFAGMG